MDHSVRRRGRPNRGGGRGNRGGGAPRGGGRGRGIRGRGQAVGKSGGPPKGPGGGGRKVGNICDEDFSLVNPDFDDDDDGNDSYSVSQVKSAKPQNPPSLSKPRRDKTKVPMQKLYMSTENQEMVKDMLKQLHEGSDEEENEEKADYDELDWRADSQYWMTDNRLVIQQHAHHENELENAKVYDEFIAQMALKKLQKYGFEKVRCQSALEKCNGDIGQSLEYLVSQCFNLPPPDTDPNPRSKPLPDGLASWDEIDEERNQEKLVLESMYDGFCEKVVNHVWALGLEIPYLTKWASERLNRKSKADIQKELSEQRKEVCRFYMKGNCKFSKESCRYRHETPQERMIKEQEQANKDKEEKEALANALYTLEIRFPPGNLYPFQAPYVIFCSNNDLLPSGICLNISERLMMEAKVHAQSGLAAVFSLVSILENEDELKVILGLPEHRFSVPEPIISRKQMLANVRKSAAGYSSMRTNYDMEESGNALGDDNLDAEMETEENLKHKYGRKDIVSRPVDPKEREKVHRRLKERFKSTQKTGAYEKMVGKRRLLPAWGKQAEILQSLRENQVVVISGMTGCGKSTQVPQYILDSHLLAKGSHMCNIVCTQPRRISAMAVAERVAEERIEKVGGIVGYQIRLESVMSSRTRLLFCTTGILLRRLESDTNLGDITHIIVDEVHERSEESDFLMMILRDMLPNRPDLKVILMSATLNADLFSSYFYDCAVIDIPGKTFPVVEFFLEDTIEMTGFVIEDRSPFARPLKKMNAVRNSDKGATRPSIEDIEDELANLNVQSVAPPKDNVLDQNLSVKQLFRRYSGYKKSTVKCMSIMDHEKINYDLIETLVEYIVGGDHDFPEEGAILVFLPGLAEITTLYEQLQANSFINGKNKNKARVIPLHSTLSSEEQHIVFQKPPAGIRKIVLSTNIAETSITIDDIVFVIDAGKMKEKRYDPSKGMESLDTVWVSRANALQRRGRAGRVMAGICFHLFTGHRFDFHLRDQPIPEIQRAPLEQMVLKIKMLDIFFGEDVKGVLERLIEGPSLESIDTAMQRLQDLGALDFDWQLTALGYHLAALPVDVRIGKLMLFGAIFRCLDPALTIAACLSFKSPFVAPFEKRDAADAKKLEFATGNSDHLTMWKAYKQWMEANDRSNYAGYSFCQDNFLSIKSLQMLASMKRQFTELLSDIGFVKEGLTNKDIERMARNQNGDGVSFATGKEANVNSNNMKLVAAILVAALYPNVVKISIPENKYQASSGGAIPKAPNPDEIKFRTKIDGYINIHPSSVNFQVRYYESPYLVYHEKVKTSKVYVRDCTMVSVYPLLLFGGAGISIDLSQGQFVISVDDGWIRFIADNHQIAELVKELRQELDQLLEDKIENPSMDLCNCPRGNKIITTIVKLISTQ